MLISGPNMEKTQQTALFPNVIAEGSGIELRCLVFLRMSLITSNDAMIDMNPPILGRMENNCPVVNDIAVMI